MLSRVPAALHLISFTALVTGRVVTGSNVLVDSLSRGKEPCSSFSLNLQTAKI